MKKFSAILAILVSMGILFSCHPDAAEGNPFANSINSSYGSIIYRGQTYKTVKIGEQTWIAENLNYNINNLPFSYCDYSGCSYDWGTAMTICPFGWHLPSSIEWDKLFRYVDGTSGTSRLYDSPTAGRYLKAKSGWYSNGNGWDTYGFSALPTIGYSNEFGIWWTSSSNTNSSYAYSINMYYKDTEAYYDYDEKDNLFSVRCIQD